MSAAAAELGVQRRGDIGSRRGWIAGQQGNGGYDHAGKTIAALAGLFGK